MCCLLCQAKCAAIPVCLSTSFLDSPGLFISSGYDPEHHALGAVLPIWKVLADTVIPTEDKKLKGDMDGPKGKDHARVVRLKLDSGEPIIGLSLMSDDVQKVRFCTTVACTCASQIRFSSCRVVLHATYTGLQVLLHLFKLFATSGRKSKHIFLLNGW